MSETPASASGSACPDELALADFAAGTDGEVQARRVRTHISICDRCRRVVAALVMDDDSLSSTAADVLEETTAAAGSWRAPDHLREGAQLGRYRIVSFVGSGAMGLVYAAHDPALDRKVAIKVLRGAQSVTAAVRLEREAQAMARLAHPNVVSVFDVGTFEGRVFVAMEFVEGRTLRAWLQESRRSVEAILEVFIAAARGLHAAHEAGIVHRDFKPDNVFVAQDGRVLVADFGLARAATTDEPPADERATLPDGVRRSAMDAKLTQTAAFIGTPLYMAPEQLDGAPATARSDVFAFCVSLLEALTGHHPFAGDAPTLESLRTAIRHSRPRGALGNIRVPFAIWRELRRGLRERTDDRSASLAPLLRTMSRQLGRRRRWAIAAALVLVTVGASIGVSNQLTAEAPCSAARAPALTLWTPARASAVRDAFMRTQRTFAGDTFARVDERLARQRDALAERSERLCEDRRQGQGSERALDAQAACLRRQRAAANAVVEVFEDADARTVARAIQSVVALEPPERCDDTEALLAGPSLPTEPARRALLHAAEDALSKATAEYRTARYDEARRRAQAVLDFARSSGFASLEAPALLVTAHVADRKGEKVAARALLGQAVYAALRGRRDEVAVRAAMGAAVLAADVAPRDSAIDGWLSLAHAVVVGRDLGDVLLGRFYTGWGRILFRRGEPTRSKALLQLGVEHFDRVAGAAPLDLAEALEYGADTLDRLGETAEAGRWSLRALKLYEATFGANHPELVTVLNTVGYNARTTGDFAQARALHERSLAIARESFGEAHFRTNESRAFLGGDLAELGDYRGAITLSEQAYEATVRASGPDAPWLSNDALLLAQLLADIHDERALRYARRAMEIDAKHGADNDERASLLMRYGNVHLPLGRCDESLAAALRADALSRKSTDAVVRVEVARVLADSRRCMGEHAVARAGYLEALALAKRAPPGVSPPTHEVHMGLAHLATRAGQHDVALAHLERLQEDLPTLGGMTRARAELQLAEALARSTRAATNQARIREHALRALPTLERNATSPRIQARVARARALLKSYGALP